MARALRRQPSVALSADQGAGGRKNTHRVRPSWLGCRGGVGPAARNHDAFAYWFPAGIGLTVSQIRAGGLVDLISQTMRREPSKHDTFIHAKHWKIDIERGRPTVRKPDGAIFHIPQRHDQAA